MGQTLKQRRRIWIWVLALLLLAIAVSAGYFGWIVPMTIRDNERTASQGLKMLATAEADFRANDRDGNRVNDFWTGDVSGLYFINPGGVPIQLIPLALAEADAAPLGPRRSKPMAFEGYLFVMMERDDSMVPP